MTEDEKIELKRSIAIAYEFAVHLIVGSLIFLAVAAFAAALGYAMTLLENLTGVDIFILYGLKGLKYIIFAVDLGLYLVFLISQARHTGRKLWQQ